MFDSDDLWVGILRQAVLDCQAGDESAKKWIIEIGAPICKKLEWESVVFYLLRIAKGQPLPFVIEARPIKKTKLTKWQRHLADVQNLMQAEPGITQSEIVRRLNIPRGRVLLCVKYLREN